MNPIIKPETVDFTTLVNTNKKLSVNFKSKMIDTLTENFTEPQHHWYISNLFMYINYHQTTDFPVNLEDVVKIAGFAHKKNAKRALENNFVLDQDYKITVLPTEHGQFASEEILLNLDTFKNLLMLVKTPQGKEIRKYYVQLENIYNKIVNEERIETAKLLEEQKQLLIENESAHIKDKQQILLDSYDGKSVVYLILICGMLYKFGNTDNIKRRFQEHLREIGPNIKLIFCIESKNNTLLENKLKEYLKKTKHRKEQIINGKVQTELIEINDICIIKNTLEELNINLEDQTKIILELQHKILKLEKELELYKNGDKKCLVFPKPMYESFFNCNLQYRTGSKVYLKLILDKISVYINKNNIRFLQKNMYSNGVVNFHGYSSEYKDELIKYIKELYPNVIYKDQGVKRHFLNLSLKDGTTHYSDKIYQNFINEFIQIGNQERHKNQSHKYKVRTQAIINKFNEYTTENKIEPLFKKNEKDLIFSKELILKFCELTGSRIGCAKIDGVDYRCFVGIILRE